MPSGSYSYDQQGRKQYDDDFHQPSLYERTMGGQPTNPWEAPQGNPWDPTGDTFSSSGQSSASRGQLPAGGGAGNLGPVPSVGNYFQYLNPPSGGFASAYDFNRYAASVGKQNQTDPKMLDSDLRMRETYQQGKIQMELEKMKLAAQLAAQKQQAFEAEQARNNALVMQSRGFDQDAWRGAYDYYKKYGI